MEQGAQCLQVVRGGLKSGDIESRCDVEQCVRATQYKRPPTPECGCGDAPGCGGCCCRAVLAELVCSPNELGAHADECDKEPSRKDAERNGCPKLPEGEMVSQQGASAEWGGIGGVVQQTGSQYQRAGQQKDECAVSHVVLEAPGSPGVQFSAEKRVFQRVMPSCSGRAMRGRSVRISPP